MYARRGILQQDQAARESPERVAPGEQACKKVHVRRDRSCFAFARIAWARSHGCSTLEEITFTEEKRSIGLADARYGRANLK